MWAGPSTRDSQRAINPLVAACGRAGASPETLRPGVPPQELHKGHRSPPPIHPSSAHPFIHLSFVRLSIPRAALASQPPQPPSAMNQIEPGVQYNYVYDEDEYMIQEEEWDRDLLLDPAWEKQQRKVSRVPHACLCSGPHGVGVSPFVGTRRGPLVEVLWSSQLPTTPAPSERTADPGTGRTPGCVCVCEVNISQKTNDVQKILLA